MDASLTPSSPGAGMPSVTEDQLQACYDRAVRTYIQQRHARVPAFIDQHFGFKGSLRLHRSAIGWDLLRAPVNALGGPLTVLGDVTGRGLSAAGLKRAGAKVRARRYMLETDVGRQLAFVLHRDLLELPYASGVQQSTDDALLQALLQEPEVSAQLEALLDAVAPHQGATDFADRATAILAEYVDSRVAAAEITSNLLMAAGGWIAFKKMTPGLVSLSSALATGIAHQAALHSFWAGPWVAKLYYSVVGVSAPWALTAGVFGALLIPASFIAAFAGVLADPVQRRLGWHEKRLHRMLDGLERDLLGQGEGIGLKDHYVARLFDIFDWSQALIRLARQS